LGHEIDKIRTDKGLGMIESIRKDREKPKKQENVEFYDLKTVRKELNRIVRMINADIEKIKIIKYIKAMLIYSILRVNFSFVVPMLYLQIKNAYKSLIYKRLYFLKAVRTRRHFKIKKHSKSAN